MELQESGGEGVVTLEPDPRHDFLDMRVEQHHSDHPRSSVRVCGEQNCKKLGEAHGGCVEPIEEVCAIHTWKPSLNPQILNRR